MGTGPELKVVLASRRNRAGKLVWGLPKGLVEQGEGPEEAAIREVREETGLLAEIEDSLGDVSYWYVWDEERIRKKVTFFLMRAVGGDPTDHDHEMEEVRWFPFAEALRRAAYRSERETIQKAGRALGAAG